AHCGKSSDRAERPGRRPPRLASALGRIPPRSPPSARQSCSGAAGAADHLRPLRAPRSPSFNRRDGSQVQVVSEPRLHLRCRRPCAVVVVVVVEGSVGPEAERALRRRRRRGFPPAADSGALGEPEGPGVRTACRRSEQALRHRQEAPAARSVRFFEGEGDHAGRGHPRAARSPEVSRRVPAADQKAFARGPRRRGGEALFRSHRQGDRIHHTVPVCRKKQRSVFSVGFSAMDSDCADSGSPPFS
ncbi:MAG: hypothetical protein BJ554DRAFT_2133, partial [Olpidium bornovanus]